MPRQTEWFQRLPEIFARLDQAPPLLDRAAIERLFRVSPRQATRILHRMEAAHSGGALVIARDELQRRLEQLQTGEAIVYEQERRRRLHATLEEARQEIRSRRIAIAAPPQDGLAIAGLPEEIELRPGHLQVRFQSPAELLERLMLLARTISEDWAAFEIRLGVGRHAERPIDR